MSSLQFFIDHAHPGTGLVRDKANNFSDETPDNNVSSMASTGFALAVIAHASLQGRVTPEFAQAYCSKTLRFSLEKVPRKYGWFLHWVHWETGERIWDSEYSTIDSALFLGGALYAAQVFPNSECARLARQAYQQTDFIAAMTNAGTKPDKRTLSMGYMEETGWIHPEWNMYAEQKLLIILGLGHPTSPLPPETWLAFSRDKQVLPSGDPVMGLHEALFVHQYSEAFIDFRNFRDPSGDMWLNSVRISQHHRDVARNDGVYQTLKEGFWGFSAGESPTGYSIHNPVRYNGTVCIGCTVASAMFLPQVVIDDLKLWLKTPYRDRIWGRYGFTDSIDIDQNWYGGRVLGITVGAAYMSLTNIKEETSIWRHFMQIPEIKTGMERAQSASLYKEFNIM